MIINMQKLVNRKQSNTIGLNIFLKFICAISDLYIVIIVLKNVYSDKNQGIWQSDSIFTFFINMGGLLGSLKYCERYWPKIKIEEEVFNEAVRLVKNNIKNGRFSTDKISVSGNLIQGKAQ